MRPLLAMAACALFAGCVNAGEDRILAIQATGSVGGTVFFDANGSGALETAPGTDSGLAGARVHLFVRGTRDTVATATTAALGAFSIPDVPVGSYVVVLDRSLLGDAGVGDTLELIGADTATVTVMPDSTPTFTVGVGYPRLTVAQARAHPVGRRVVVVGVALNNRTGVFRDTTVHLQDTSGAVRLAQLRTLAVFAQDSLRVRATTGNPALRGNQPFLFDVTVVFQFAGLGFPTSVTLSTAAAAVSAANDAQLVVVDSAMITDTATVSGDRRLTVDDGSGPLEVLLDGTWFTPPAPAAEVYVPGNAYRFFGVLVPSGTGTWRLKPRNAQDLAPPQ